MNIISLLKNMVYRILTKKEVIVMAVIIIPIIILTAVLFSGRVYFKTNIALISDDVNSVNVQAFPQNNKFRITVLDKKPEMSNVVLGYYDAIVEKDGGSYKVTTVIKSKTDTKIIEDYFNKGISPDDYESKDRERGLGTKILGFIVMVLLMQSVAITILYPEDRSLKTFGRILTTPVNENQYILAQGIFTFLCVSIPTYIALIITKICLGISMGYNIVMLAILVGIFSIFATAFGLFISSILKNNITLTASAIAIITSLLAGCLVPFTAANKVIDALLSIIPQRGYILMADGMEKGRSIFEFKFAISNLIIWTIVLLFLGIYSIKGKVKKGNY